MKLIFIFTIIVGFTTTQLIAKGNCPFPFDDSEIFKYDPKAKNSGINPLKYPQKDATSYQKVYKQNELVQTMVLKNEVKLTMIEWCCAARSYPVVWVRNYHFENVPMKNTRIKDLHGALKKLMSAPPLSHKLFEKDHLDSYQRWFYDKKQNHFEASYFELNGFILKVKKHPKNPGRYNLILESRYES